VNEWLAIALTPAVRNRAVKVALLVGSIIAIINYGDKVFSGALMLRDVAKILMTFLVPYCVSTYSAVSAIQEAARNRAV
jgi:short subunit fatty acids transporter